ncbi:hypothetical protein CC80DRAFT_543167 [Byssothecium circinans]|uniref:Uncharacterized protein n=1 Tax=Byssothecium circinans TaxID=147558 RepID=A0A6A5UAN5_9PLEO|nr:hypothetical protein CC80DRAFT_543167 [Byssothecium circinans]
MLAQEGAVPSQRTEQHIHFTTKLKDMYTAFHTNTLCELELPAPTPEDASYLRLPEVGPKPEEEGEDENVDASAPSAEAELRYSKLGARFANDTMKHAVALKAWASEVDGNVNYVRNVWRDLRDARSKGSPSLFALFLWAIYLTHRAYHILMELSSDKKWTDGMGQQFTTIVRSHLDSISPESTFPSENGLYKRFSTGNSIRIAHNVMGKIREAIRQQKRTHLFADVRPQNWLSFPRAGTAHISRTVFEILKEREDFMMQIVDEIAYLILSAYQASIPDKSSTKPVPDPLVQAMLDAAKPMSTPVKTAMIPLADTLTTMLEHRTAFLDGATDLGLLAALELAVETTEAYIWSSDGQASEDLQPLTSGICLTLGRSFHGVFGDMDADDFRVLGGDSASRIFMTKLAMDFYCEEIKKNNGTQNSQCTRQGYSCPQIPVHGVQPLCIPGKQYSRPGEIHIKLADLSQPGAQSMEGTNTCTAGAIKQAQLHIGLFLVTDREEFEPNIFTAKLLDHCTANEPKPNDRRRKLNKAGSTFPQLLSCSCSKLWSSAKWVHTCPMCTDIVSTFLLCATTLRAMGQKVMEAVSKNISRELGPLRSQLPSGDISSAIYMVRMCTLLFQKIRDAWQNGNTVSNWLSLRLMANTLEEEFGEVEAKGMHLDLNYLG